MGDNMLDKKTKIIIDKIKEMNGNSTDIAVHEMTILNTKVAYIFLESTSSDDKISDFLGKSLSIDARKEKSVFDNVFDALQNTIPNSKLKITKTYEELFYYLASGFTCVIVEGYDKAIVLETKANLDRSIDQASSEPVLKGPKDSFNENYQTNIGLIRKRIKDPNLWFTETSVGRRTKTKVAIAYIKDIVDEKRVNRLKKKLEEIDIDGIIDSNYIRELLVSNQKSILPRVISTERPDIVSISLLDGKIAILVENTPYVLLLPTVFMDFFHSPEDYYLKPLNSSFTRILRILAFFIAILVPAFYVAVTTFDMEVIPNLLLISFAIQRESVPFPTIIEVLIMIISYEMLKEADTRKPQTMGASISIVGALILGDAAVSAGIISPIVVIIVSLSAVSGMAFNDPDMINAIRTWRILFMLSACFFGLIGILVMGVIFIAKLSSMSVLDTPYLAPLAPFAGKDFIKTIFRLPQPAIHKRPLYLKDKNVTRLGGEQ